MGRRERCLPLPATVGNGWQVTKDTQAAKTFSLRMRDS